MTDPDDIRVIKNERGIGTGETRSGVEPRPNADGSIPSTGNARNPAIVTDPAGKTPGSADAGSARVAGCEISPGRPGGAELRARVGLLTESPGFYDRLTARENLLYFAELQRAPQPGRRCDALLDRFALREHADRPFAELS